MRRMYSKPQLLEAVEQESKINGITLGNTIIDGVLQINEYELDEDLNLTADATKGFSCPYSHMRVSNGKLNIVILLTHNGTTQPTSDDWIVSGQEISIPKAINDKLVAITDAVIARDMKNVLYATSTALAQREVFVAINKESDTKLKFYIRYKGASDSMTTGVVGCVRFEFNFII